MKDFYDLWYLSRTFAFDGPLLVEAIRATFSRRATAIPLEGLPFALTKEFSEDAAKSRQWQTFLAKAELGNESISLREVTDHLITFLKPCLAAAESNVSFSQHWSASGSWQDSD